MPKSGSKAKSAKSQKTKKSIAICPFPVPAASPATSTALLSPAEARVARALHKYEISYEDFKDAPPINDIIWRIFGANQSALSFLGYSQDPEAKRFLQFLRTMTADERDFLPLQICCMAAEVNPNDILGQIFVCARGVSSIESSLVLMMKNPDTLRATANYGINFVDNVKDREMILRSTKTLPTSKGGGINIFMGDKTDDDMEDVPIEESSMEEDVFRYDQKTIDGWGDRRRQLMDELKRK